MARISDFEPNFPGGTYDKWLTTTPADRAHQDECGCPRCHQWHKEEGIFMSECQSCEEEYCAACKGTGWIDYKNEIECLACKATGRIS